MDLHSKEPPLARQYALRALELWQGGQTPKQARRIADREFQRAGLLTAQVRDERFVAASTWSTCSGWRFAMMAVGARSPCIVLCCTGGSRGAGAAARAAGGGAVAAAGLGHDHRSQVVRISDHLEEAFDSVLPAASGILVLRPGHKMATT